MFGDACETINHVSSSAWMELERGNGSWLSRQDADKSALPRPSANYSRRSGLISGLREKSALASIEADEYIRAPSLQALESAELFINSLPEGCLDLRIAIPQSGEINFFQGSDHDLFQILIDASGLLSYYGNVAGEEIGESDLPPERFPYMKLLQFVDRLK